MSFTADNRNSGIGEPWYNAHRTLSNDVKDDGRGRTLSRIFFGAGEAGEAHGDLISLDRAELWRDEQANGAAGGRMLLLAHERPRADWAETRKTGRVYEVVAAELFFQRYAARRRTSMWRRGACQYAAGRGL